MEGKALLLHKFNELFPGQTTGHLALAELFQHLDLKNGKLLDDQEIASPSICFLSKGILHYQRKNPKRTHPNQCLHLYLTGEFLPFPSKSSEAADSHQYFTIMDCELFVASEEDIKMLAASNPIAKTFLEHFYHKWQQKHLDRIALLMTNPATKRYNIVKTQLGSHFYQIPQQILANYLHLSRKHLWRLHSQHLNSK